MKCSLDIRLSDDGQYLTFTVPVDWVISNRNRRKTIIPPQLSPREREVFIALVRGLQNKEIAQEMEIATRTVKFHASRIFQKLGIRSRLDVIARFAA